MANCRILNFPNSISIDKQSMKTLNDSTPIEEDEDKEQNQEEEELIREEVNIESLRDNDRGYFLHLQQELRRNNEFISNAIERFEDGKLVGLRRDVDDGEREALEEDEEEEQNKEEEQLIRQEVKIESFRDNGLGNFLLLQQELRCNNEFISSEIERFEDGQLAGLRRDVDDGELGALEVVMNSN